MSERYSREERDRIGRSTYERFHQNDASGPWESLTSHRRWFWCQAGIAAHQEAARIDDERLTAWRRERRQTRRVA